MESDAIDLAIKDKVASAKESKNPDDLWEAMDFMLNRFSRDLSSLMQLLDQLDAYALQTQRAITIPLIKSMLDNQ